MSLIGYNGLSFASSKGRLCTLDDASTKTLAKIYCACGKIVDLDKSVIKVKHSLKKEVECTVCRNLRISRDIDALNAHFGINGDETQDDIF
jgi:hypothetical protein